MYSIRLLHIPLPYFTCAEANEDGPACDFSLYLPGAGLILQGISLYLMCQRKSADYFRRVLNVRDR